MQPIRTAESIAQKERRNRRVGGIMIIALLVLSTLGFALSGVGFKKTQESGFTYNGQYWVYTAGAQQYAFTHHPDELTDVSVSITKNLGDYSGRQVYISSDGLGIQEIATNLGRYAANLGEACYGPCGRDVVEKTCMEEPLIVVRESEEQKVYEENNCVFIDGDLKAVDAFLYRVLGLN